MAFISKDKDNCKRIVLEILKRGGVVRHREMYRIMSPDADPYDGRTIPTSHYKWLIARKIITKVAPGRYGVHPEILKNLYVVPDKLYEDLQDPIERHRLVSKARGLEGKDLEKEMRRYLQKRESAQDPVVRARAKAKRDEQKANYRDRHDTWKEGVRVYYDDMSIENILIPDLWNRDKEPLR